MTGRDIEPEGFETQTAKAVRDEYATIREALSALYSAVTCREPLSDKLVTVIAEAFDSLAVLESSIEGDEPRTNVRSGRTGEKT